MSNHLRVFDADGRPSDQWDRLDAIFAFLLRHKRQLKDRRDDIGAFVQLIKWEQLIAGLLCIELPHNELLNSFDTTQILMRALGQCAETRENDPREARKIFVRLCNSEVSALLGIGERDFTVHTSLSLPPEAAGEFVYQGATVSCGENGRPCLPPPPILDEAVHADLAELWKRCRYRRISVRVSALTANDAVRKGLRVVNLIRALVTLHYGSGTESVQMVGRRQAPIALLHLGPLHLVTEGTGDAFINDLWDEELYTQDWKPYPEQEKWDTVAQQVKDLLVRIDRLPYRAQMEELLCRYINALDETRWSVTLLQLWSVLEKLTNTVGHGQKHMSSRASRVFPDGHLARNVIEAVRCTRNRLVHAGHARGLNERWASELKPTVEAHLHHLLFNTFDVDGTDEYAAILEMPRASTVLCREIALRRAMMKFQDGRT